MHVFVVEMKNSNLSIEVTLHQTLEGVIKQATRFNNYDDADEDEVEVRDGIEAAIRANDFSESDLVLDPYNGGEGDDGQELDCEDSYVKISWVDITRLED